MLSLHLSRPCTGHRKLRGQWGSHARQQCCHASPDFEPYHLRQLVPSPLFTMDEALDLQLAALRQGCLSAGT